MKVILILEKNQPLYRHFLTPGSFSIRDVCPLSFYEEAELGDFLPTTGYPAIRARVSRRRCPDWADTMLYDVERDYGQTQNLAGTGAEARYEASLIETLQAMDAPPSQHERLGLKQDLEA